jgi:soluble lytic murein transglycosylase-like protein
LSRFARRNAGLRKTIAQSSGNSFYDGDILARKSANTEYVSGVSGGGDRLASNLRQETPLPNTVRARLTVSRGAMLIPVPITSAWAKNSTKNGLKTYFNMSLSEMSRKLFSISSVAKASFHRVKSYARGISSEIHDTIYHYASKYLVDPNLVTAMVKQESDGNRYAVSSAGAMGLGQLMPETAKRFGVFDPFDERQNIQGMVRYLKFLGERFNGDKVLMVAAYNTGEGRRSYRYGLVPRFHETVDYLGRVFNNYFHLTGRRVEFQDRIVPSLSAS